MLHFFNPLWWFAVFFPKPYPPEEKKSPVWEMEFMEVYSTRIRSDKIDKDEAIDQCYNLFNVHNSSKVRIQFDTEIKKI